MVRPTLVTRTAKGRQAGRQRSCRYAKSVRIRHVAISWLGQRMLGPAEWACHWASTDVHVVSLLIGRSWRARQTPLYLLVATLTTCVYRSLASHCCCCSAAVTGSHRFMPYVISYASMLPRLSVKHHWEIRALSDEISFSYTDIRHTKPVMTTHYKRTEGILAFSTYVRLHVLRLKCYAEDVVPADGLKTAETKCRNPHGLRKAGQWTFGVSLSIYSVYSPRR